MSKKVIYEYKGFVVAEEKIGFPGHGTTFAVYDPDDIAEWGLEGAPSVDNGPDYVAMVAKVHKYVVEGY